MCRSDCEGHDAGEWSEEELCTTLIKTLCDARDVSDDLESALRRYNGEGNLWSRLNAALTLSRGLTQSLDVTTDILVSRLHQGAEEVVDEPHRT